MEEETGNESEAAEHKEREAREQQGKANGWEIGYQRFTIDGKCLGYGEPVRVKEGQRLLFHILNASATENIQLALPGHQFQVVALDGNPVPRSQMVDVLELGTAERISAVVEMKSPGVWILGTPKEDDRKNGMGIVVEYANKRARLAGSNRRRTGGITRFSEGLPARSLRFKRFRWFSARSMEARAASTAGQSTGRASTRTPRRPRCRKAGATAWCSTTSPTTLIRSIFIGTASSLPTSMGKRRLAF
jgi:FtsP/CotA-like multicopper oxidase with cupredoxin domain